MGDRERGDIRAALDWARTEGYTPDRIGWLGYSMGGATLLLEGAKNPNLTAVVIDSAYGDLPELLDRQLTQHSGLPSLFNPGILLAARLAFDVKTDHLVPIDAARGWNRPILLIHGESDSIVPIEQARRLARSIGANCQVEFRPRIEHVGAYNASPEWYIATVKAFFDRNLAPSSRSSSSSETHP
jgi:dienelactone hydrolase